ncbi:hypothetical protein ACET3X_007925 [Alternaria dauci]|uniref:Uncharacterized protein n=1 Tax=Alternaria dauci TaxID=48095 RepID=A0ABR3UF88_9PLEO
MSGDPVYCIVCCTEAIPDTVLDPALYFNTRSSETEIHKMNGAQVTADHEIMNSISKFKTTYPMGMIAVLGHSNCTLAPNGAKAAIQSSVQAIRNTLGVANTMFAMGYVLNVGAIETKMKEVHIPSASGAAASVAALALEQQQSSDQQDIAPFIG